MELKDIDYTNIDRMIQGYQYSYLPEGFLLDDLESNLKKVVVKLLKEESKYCYNFKNSLIELESIKGVISPSYIFNFGAEPLSFFDFKKNGSYREIQIPNLIFYIAFMNNSINSSDSIFNKIYSTGNKFTTHSNSYVVFEKEFSIHNSYDKTVQEIICGEFATRNNKMVNQLTTKNRAINYLEKMSSNLFVLKLDIESFYPNIYTHLLSQVKYMKPYIGLISNSDYFEFLDRYNMKINSNQTKGIMSGCFSSNVSSELLMLCVDYEISEYIEDLNVKYIRYVDDFTFFSDSKEQLMIIIAFVQKVLNKYKLRINHNKTEVCENILFEDSLDFNNIEHDFILIKEIWNSYEDFIQLKRLFKGYLELSKISEIKVLLTRIARKIRDKEFDLTNVDNVSEYMINYLLQLMFYDSNLAVNCYKVLLELLKYCNSQSIDKEQLIKCLTNKSTWINERYANTLIQIWHYYLLNKFGTSNDIHHYFSDLLKLTDEQNESINPLVLVSFIQKGDNNNRNIFNYILREYKKEIKTATDWKSSIMLSKWWLPLIRIRNVDQTNYQKFYSSQHFNSLWTEISSTVNEF